MNAALAERGLIETFADVPYVDITQNEVPGVGPGGKSGVIITYKSPKTDVPHRLGYRADEQEWHPIGDGSLLWIGYLKHDPPTAADMERRKTFTGYEIELADGCGKWLVPICRRPDGSSELPRDMYWDAAGRKVTPVKKAYDAIWQDTAPALGWFHDSEPVDEEAALKLAIRVIALNYRYGVLEHNILRYIDSTNYLTIVSAAIDYPGYLLLRESQKKTDESQAELSSTPG